MITNEYFQYCPHLTWSMGGISVNSTYRQEYMNCSKIFIKNPWDIEGVWKGKYARWFEECSRSQADSASGDDPQVTATFWNKDFFDAITERVIKGTVDPESATYCYKLQLIGSDTPVVATVATSEGYKTDGDMVKSNDGTELIKMFYTKVFNFMYDL